MTIKPPRRFNRELFIDLITVLITLAIFLLIKSEGFFYRFGDGNAYFYMAQQVLKGIFPYRDFLIADPPLLIFLLAGIKLVIGSNILLFQVVPIFLETITALILYLEVKKKLPNYAKFFPALYLFSFLILSTTDYLTGLHFITFFIALGYFFRHKPYLSGFFWGLATLIKLYVIPGFIGWLVWLKISKQPERLKKTVLAYVGTGVVFMLPFLIMAPKAVVDQIIIHQFNRPAGLNKLSVFRFFILHDFLLLCVSTATFFLNKKLKFFLPIFAWLIFFLIFKDLYYLYLGVLGYWLMLTVFQLLTHFKKPTQHSWLAHNHQQLSLMVVITLLLSQVIGVFIYYQSTQKQGIFFQIEELVKFVNTLPEKPLYGSHEVAPIIALKTGRKLFNDYADTNMQLFGSGVIDREKISQEAVEEGVHLLVKVTNIPENLDLDQGYSGYFEPEIFEQCCERLTIIDGAKLELFTDIGVYHCKK